MMTRHEHLRGRKIYGHQTSTLFTITTIEIHHRQTKKKGKARQMKIIVYMEILRSREKNKQKKPTHTEKHAFIRKKQKTSKINIQTIIIIINKMKLKTWHTSINIQLTQAHMIAEPYDSSVKMK